MCSVLLTLGNFLLTTSKMAKFMSILFTVLIFYEYSEATPSENNFVSESILEPSSKLDDEPYGIGENINMKNNKQSNERQKRFYDYLGFEYPSFDFPSNFPYPSRVSYTKRDDSQNTAVYGTESSLTYILKQLQEIVGETRRQTQSPPSHTVLPAFIPIFYLPPINCACSATTQNNNQTPSPPPNTNKINNRPTTSSPPNKDSTIPDLPDRFEPENPEQNWGIVVNKTSPNNLDNENGNDGDRPISLDPIVPQEPLDAPIPPVEHGSVQAGADPAIPVTTTFRPQSEKPLRAPAPPTEMERPTLCDGAIITCCLKKPITRNCFTREGCSDTSTYKDPCDPQEVHKAAVKISAYLKSKRGIRRF